MRRQKKIRSLVMPYEKQQEIYFTCRRYAEQSAEVQGRIDRICDEVAGDGHKRHALFRVLTTDVSIWRIANECYIAKTVLYELRKAFYEQFLRENKKD